jgi:hypothetical protein
MDGKTDYLSQHGLLIYGKNEKNGNKPKGFGS